MERGGTAAILRTPWNFAAQFQNFSPGLAACSINYADRMRELSALGPLQQQRENR